MDTVQVNTETGAEPGTATDCNTITDSETLDDTYSNGPSGIVAQEPVRAKTNKHHATTGNNTPPKKGKVGRPKSNRTDMIVPQLGIVLEPSNYEATQTELGARYVMELEYDCTVLIGKLFELIDKIGSGNINFYFTPTGVDILVRISGDTRGMADVTSTPGNMFIRLDGSRANTYYINKPFSICIDIAAIAKRIINSAKHYNSLKFSITSDALHTPSATMQIKFSYLSMESYDLVSVPFTKIPQPHPDHLKRFMAIQYYTLRFQTTVAYLKTVIISAQSSMIKHIQFYYADGNFIIQHMHENQSVDKVTHFNKLGAINFIHDGDEDNIISCTVEHKNISNILNKDISEMAYISVEDRQPMGICFNLDQVVYQDPGNKHKFHVKNSEKIQVTCLLEQPDMKNKNRALHNAAPHTLIQ